MNLSVIFAKNKCKRHKSLYYVIIRALVFLFNGWLGSLFKSHSTFRLFNRLFSLDHYLFMSGVDLVLLKPVLLRVEF